MRGSSGTVFRLPVVAGLEAAELGNFATERDLQLLACDGSGGEDYLAADLRRPSILVLGGEGDGLPGEILEAADKVVRIPMCEPVESLNVAVAAGVVLFEARRQRL